MRLGNFLIVGISILVLCITVVVLIITMSTSIKNTENLINRNNELFEENIKLKNKIHLLMNEKSTCNEALNDYELATAHYFESHRHGGVELFCILENIRKDGRNNN